MTTGRFFKRLVDAVPVGVSVNMGFGIRSRPTTPLISIARLQAIGVRRVTVPRMLPAAAIMGMRNALPAFRAGLGHDAPPDRTDLLVGIEEITELMGYAEVRSLEARYLGTSDFEERYADAFRDGR